MKIFISTCHSLLHLALSLSVVEIVQAVLARLFATFCCCFYRADSLFYIYYLWFCYLPFSCYCRYRQSRSILEQMHLRFQVSMKSCLLIVQTLSKWELPMLLSLPNLSLKVANVLLSPLSTYLLALWFHYYSEPATPRSNKRLFCCCELL